MSRASYWLTGITGAVCLFSLWNLYQTKQQAKLIQTEIAHVKKETVAANEHTARLKMEWGVLNQPERLEDLSKRFLPNLRPTETSQFAQLDQAAERLPSTYDTAKLNHHVMLADNQGAKEGNLSLARSSRNNIAPMPASVVAHEEDGGLESAINDLEHQKNPQHSQDSSYDKLLTAFHSTSDTQMPSEL